jgi:ABC-2 type transport system permease protein
MAAEPPGGPFPRLRRGLRLYWLLLAASLRGALQYRMNIAIMVLAGAVYHGSGFAFLWVLLHTFGTVAGWDLSQIAFLYGLRLLAHALWLVTLNGINDADYLIREGHFERMLLRPLNPLVQLATTQRSLLSFGDLSVALAVFGVAAGLANVDWSPWSVLFLALAVIGGALIEASASLGVAGIAIRVLNTWALRAFVDDTIGTLGAYPMGIFGVAAQRTLTYAIPVAFIAYLPASVLLRRTGQLAVPAVLGYATPLVGIALFTLAYLFWHRQLRHYQGVGH